eukprot:NODE_1775_length_2376_cov_4.437972.p1 GENE.NODE_1775_length_2376_cov_4.437972~~NODE_1775_length_2376_cov_4.437972.p1  ORF type:complete len:721 (-),score=201.89 NODE_1775_length_2376_cov_4.437972:213-2153(-)
MNDASTRSHCMFILWIDATTADSDNVRRAKLHLVDLAGSERISKTGVEGHLQKEARYINLSLHYLEQVIKSLQDRSQGSRNHVPYRNSMMTSVLRDSLGGNCKTVMIGALAVEEQNLEETMTTCRFAQRVASIKNNAMINEELDPALLIRRLKKEVAELKDELKLSSSANEELTKEELAACSRLVSAYVDNTDANAAFVCSSVHHFRACFRILRDIYWQRQRGATGAPAPRVGTPVAGSLQATAMELREQVTNRDREIAMLVSSLGKHNRGQEAMKDGRVFIRGGAPPRPAGAPLQQAVALGSNGSGGSSGSDARPMASSDVAALLLDRNRAFEVFRKSVRRSEIVEENHEEWKKLVLEAKALGEKANAAHAAIKTHSTKTRMEKARFAMDRSPYDPESARGATQLPESPEAHALQRSIDEQKAIYQQCTQRLHHVKAEIEQFQQARVRNQQRLQKDFEMWCAALQGTATVEGTVDPSQVQGMVFAAAPVAAAATAAHPPASGWASDSEQQVSWEMASSGHSSSNTASRPVKPHAARSGVSPQAKEPGGGTSTGFDVLSYASTNTSSASTASTYGRRSGATGRASGGGGLCGAAVVAAATPPTAKAPTAAAASIAPKLPPSATTGDPETDGDIAAFFAAVAELHQT